MRLAKPAHLARRGRCWFRGGDAELHLGIEEDFRPAGKAHPALLVRDLDDLGRRLSEAGREVSADTELERHSRIYTTDLFGNRVELIERSG
jgi:hypothetical protein